MKKAVISAILLIFSFSAVVSAAPSGLWGQWILSPEFLAGDSLRAVSGRSGKLDGNLSFTEGPFGTSWNNFGESRILLYKGGPGGLSLPKDQITIEMWGKSDSFNSGQGVINFVQDNMSYERGFYMGFGNYKVEVAIATETKPGVTPPLDYVRSWIELGVWYHVTYTYDGKVAKLYVNGKLVDSSERSTGPILYPESSSLVIGAYVDDNEEISLIGALREVRIYSRALTEAEVQASKPGIVEEVKQIASNKGNSVVVVLSDGKTIKGSLVQVEGEQVLVLEEGSASPQSIALKDIIAILPIK